LLYWLRQQEGQVFLNDVWGRQTTGQSISLDGSVIDAFIEMLNYYRDALNYYI